MNIDVVMSAPGSVSVGDYTTMTISGGRVTFNYYKETTNEDLYFNYMYKTDMTFVK